MKRLFLLSLVTLSGCLNFDALLDAGCASDAAWAECRGGADAGVVFGGDGGFCSSSGWCWENPSLPGAVDLFAVWGTSDTDVWVAGSGGTVLRFNGTRWWQPDVVLNSEPFSLIQPEAAVRAVVIDDAGVAWLAGESMPVVGLRPGGVTRVGSVANRISAATYGGRSYFLPAGSSPFSIEQLQGGTLSSQPVPSATGVDNLLSITANGSGALIAYDRSSPNGAQVFSLASMAATTLTTPAMTEVRTPRNFTRHGDVEALVCSNGDAFESTGGTTWSYVGQVQMPGGQDLRTHAHSQLADGGSRWWFAGSQGDIVSTEGALTSGLVQYQGTLSSILQSSWVSPSGHFWAVGSAGAVVEVSPSGLVTTRGALADTLLVDLAFNGSKAVAVGRGGVMLTREAQSRTWSRRVATAQSDLCAVSLGSQGTCTVDLGGEVVCDEVSVFTLNALRSDGGLFFGGERGGCAIAQRPDGGAVVGRGNSFGVYSSGVWSPFDAGVVLNDHLAELLLTPAGFAAAVNQTADVNGSLTPVAGAVITWEGAGPRVCNSPAAPILGMARTATGFLVVGPDFAGECTSSTGTVMSVSVPRGQWVSAWVDPSGTWWILDTSGIVLRRPAGMGSWLRERLPLGPSGLDGPEMVRITGTANELFVLGKSGTVLRRLLP